MYTDLANLFSTWVDLTMRAASGSCKTVRGLQLLTWDGLYHGWQVLQRQLQFMACGTHDPGCCEAWHSLAPGVALTSSTALTLRPALDQPLRHDISIHLLYQLHCTVICFSCAGAFCHCTAAYGTLWWLGYGKDLGVFVIFGMNPNGACFLPCPWLSTWGWKSVEHHSLVSDLPASIFSSVGRKAEWLGLERCDNWGCFLHINRPSGSSWFWGVWGLVATMKLLNLSSKERSLWCSQFWVRCLTSRFDLRISTAQVMKPTFNVFITMNPGWWRGGCLVLWVVFVIQSTILWARPCLEMPFGAHCEQVMLAVRNFLTTWQRCSDLSLAPQGDSFDVNEMAGQIVGRRKEHSANFCGVFDSLRYVLLCFW